VGSPRRGAKLDSVGLGSLDGGHFGTILSDGRIEVAGQVFASPSSAAAFVRKKSTNGWNFWRLDPNRKRTLKDVRAEYLRLVSPEAEGEDEDQPDGN
jgi:hypothetical protein